MIKQFKNRIGLLQSDLLPTNAICAEVGVCEGFFAGQILAHTKPRMLHLIDIWAGIGACGAVSTTDATSTARLALVSQNFQPHVKSGQVMLHQGWSQDVLSLFSDGYFDWVYIDGDHSHSGVLRDLIAAAPKTRQYLAGHDFASPEKSGGVVHKFPGVYTAVMEFCRGWGWRLVAETEVGQQTGDDPDGSNSPSYVLERNDV